MLIIDLLDHFTPGLQIRGFTEQVLRVAGMAIRQVCRPAAPTKYPRGAGFPSADCSACPWGVVSRDDALLTLSTFFRVLSHHATEAFTAKS